MSTQSLPFEVDDAVILLLGTPSTYDELNGQIKGITRLEKLLFLLSKEKFLPSLLSEQLDFKSYNYGPFSEKIYQAIEMLSSADLVFDSAQASSSRDDMWESNSLIGIGDEKERYITRDISLTDKGKKYYQALQAEVPKELLDEIAKIKSDFGALSLRTLVRYVYENFPDYTDKSLIRDKILAS